MFNMGHYSTSKQLFCNLNEHDSNCRKEVTAKQRKVAKFGDWKFTWEARFQLKTRLSIAVDFTFRKPIEFIQVTEQFL